MMVHPALTAKVLDLAINIQQIAAPTFDEQRRGRFVQQLFEQEGLQDIVQDEIGNIFARLPGKKPRQPLVVSAHLDTVFPAQTELTLERTTEKISGPGIGDNSLGVAGLFGLAWLLEQVKPLAHDLWLVANVGEEGLGDLRGMKAVVDRFTGSPKAYLIVEGMALGSVYHRALGVQRYRITSNTEGGHSWVNFGRPSAIHQLARLVTALEKLPVQANPPHGQPRSSYNIGVIQGGTSVNTIASRASLELDLRSDDDGKLAELARQVEHMASSSNLAGEYPVTFDCQVIGRRPAGEIPVNHWLVQAAQQALQQQGLSARLDIGSTDANVPLSCGYPAVCVGLTYGNGAHTLKENIETAPLAKGLGQLLSLVQAVDGLK
jgi:tripeptide aminopeptidase